MSIEHISYDLALRSLYFHHESFICGKGSSAFLVTSKLTCNLLCLLQEISNKYRIRLSFSDE
jgi:hypothetical protein